MAVKLNETSRWTGFYQLDQLGIFLLARPKISHSYLGYFKMYVKSGKTTEKHHVEILTVKAVHLSEYHLAKGGANNAPLQEC